MDWKSTYLYTELRQWFEDWNWIEALQILQNGPLDEEMPVTRIPIEDSGSIRKPFPDYSVIEVAPKSIFTEVHWIQEMNAEKYVEIFDRNAFLNDLHFVMDSSPDAMSILNLLSRYTRSLSAQIEGREGSVSPYDLLKHRLTLLGCRRDASDPEKTYAFVGADLSGIQSFIYTIKPDGALRTLRARSFFVELLMEDAIERTLKLWSVDRHHVVYSGGGGFYLLLPNRPDLALLLRDEIAELNRWLLRTLGGGLYLSTGHFAIDDEELEDASSLWGRMAEATGRQKGQRYLEGVTSLTDLDSDPLRVRYPRLEMCSICQTDEMPVQWRHMREGSDAFCEFCYTLMMWGQKLPRATGVIRTYIRPRNDDEYLEICGVYYHLVIHEKDERVSSADWWPFITGEAPLDAKNSLNPPGYIYKDEHGHAMSFKDLAIASQGTKLLGVLRMDVDHLGKIFAKGLPSSHRDLIHLSILSHELARFFKQRLNELCESDAARGQGKFHVVYAGGDDLLMVGTWSNLAPFALEIQSAFMEYTYNNPGITISGGFIVEGYHTPLYRLAELAGETVDISKDAGRDRLTLFYAQRGLHYKKEQDLNSFEIAHPWNEVRAAYLELVVPLMHLELPSAFPQFCLSFVALFERGRSHFAHFLYYIARMSVDKRIKDNWDPVKQILVKQGHFPLWKTTFAWVKLYKQKGERIS